MGLKGNVELNGAGDPTEFSMIDDVQDVIQFGSVHLFVSSDSCLGIKDLFSMIYTGNDLCLSKNSC